MLLVAGVGSFIATDFIGIFGEEARKHMNNIIFYVFYPSLSTSNISQAFTLERLASTWFMPINVFLTFLIGSVFGWVLNKVTKAPPHLRPILLSCCASGNQGIMLLIVIPSICYENGTPFGDPAICNEQALGYASISMGIADAAIWTYVYNIVRISLGVETPKLQDRLSQPLDLKEMEEETSLSKGSFSITDHKIHCANSPTMLPVTVAPNKSKTLREAIESFSQKPAMAAFKRLLTPSTFGVIFGLLVGVISPFREAMIGTNAPLRVIQGAIIMMGQGAVPAMTLILGGNLLKGLRKSDVRVSYIIGVVLVRYLFLPLTGVIIIKGANHYGLLHPDPLYNFVLLVQYALPPAMILAVIFQLFGIGETECSVIMVWTYAVTLLLYPMWSAFFMWLVAYTKY